MKWKLQSKYESSHGPGTTQNQMGQKTSNRPRTEEALWPADSSPLPIQHFLGFWPTGPEMSVLFCSVDCGCCIVLWLWLQLHLALLFGFFIYFFVVFRLFLFYICRLLPLTNGQGVLPVCSLCSGHVLVLFQTISTYYLCV